MMNEMAFKEPTLDLATRVREGDLESLREEAVDALMRAAEGFVRWADRVREAKAPFRFYWAVNSLRDADVGSTNYILHGLDNAGALDKVLGKEQKAAGAAWIKSLEVGENSYEDPSLLAYKPPMWDDVKEAWPPTGAHKEAMNQYTRGCLRYYLDEEIDAIQGPPPPDWPQIDDADRVLEWIKAVEPNWSWIGRMIRRLMDWHLDGRISVDPLVDCVKYAYSRQDPETGFWANGIQTSFKILISVFEPMGLTVYHADRLIDSVLATMYHPDYDIDLFPCEEFDAFYDIAVAWDHAKGYRKEEILKLAAHRISYIVATNRQADEGLASYPGKCMPTWLSWDMAPAVAQGDAFGMAIFGFGFSICVDLLGIAGRTGWTGHWRYRHSQDDRQYAALGRKLKGLL